MRADRRLFVLALALALPLAGGCRVRQAMYDQAKYEPYEQSPLFANQAAMRPFPEGTVARGQYDEDVEYETGAAASGELVAHVPARVTVNGALVARGRERYDIYCSPCHGKTGMGDGMIVQRGYFKPPSYHLLRLRQAPDGHFFDVMTRGFGRMPSYASQIPVADRWAIVAYVRALQLSQNARIGALPGPVQEVAREALAQGGGGEVVESTTAPAAPSTEGPRPSAPMDENYAAPVTGNEDGE